MAGDETLGKAAITIVRRSVTRAAPEGFFFEVDVSGAGFSARAPRSGEIYDPRFHQLYYFWDFDDDYRFQAPQNLPDPHKNAGVAYGPMVSHTYRKPGIYTVSCLIVEPQTGRKALAEQAVEVLPADGQFPGNSTIFVDPVGPGADAPSGAIIVGSIEAAVSVATGQEGRARRIMLRRGQVYPFGGISLGDQAMVPSLHIVAGPGDEAKPVLKCKGQWSWNDRLTRTDGRMKDWVFQNIDFLGPWDSTTETGALITGISPQENSPNLTLIDGCSFDGFTGAYVPISGSNVLHRMTIINDTRITNWQGFGVLDGDNAGLALTGCAIWQHVNAKAGKTDLTGNNNGPFRNGGRLGRTIITNCDFFSRNGWSPFGGQYQAYQPCIRFNTDGMEGVRANIQANALEGGFWVLILMPEAGLNSHAVNAVIEKNYLLGSHMTSSTVVITYGGTTLRNNVFVQPNQASLPVSGELACFIELKNIGGDARNRAAPISSYNNSFIHLTPQSSYQFADPPPRTLKGADQFAVVNEANNLVHMPNLIPPIVGDAPLQDSPVLWAPRERGYISSAHAHQPQTATPRDVVATYAPRPGSPALGNALNGLVAFDDFYGNPRPAYPSRGAFEAS